MTSLNISLPESLREFVETEVKEDGFSTPSEYVRSLIREAQRRKVEEKLLLAGLRSGKSSPMTRKGWNDVRRQAVKRLGRSEPKRRK